MSAQKTPAGRRSSPRITARHRHLGNLLARYSPAGQLNKIVADGMCIGCGLCQSIAGADTIRMVVSESGEEQPCVTGELTETVMQQIVATCPGTTLEGLPAWQVDDDSNYDELWGVWRQLRMAWSAEPDVRHIGSTGGLLTALSLYLLEQRQVDFIVHANADHDEPSFGARTISRTRQDVLDAAGSRYGPTATLIDFAQIVNRCRDSGETFAFIGTPCDIGAARNLARSDETVDQVCRYFLTMVCGGFMSSTGMRSSLESFGVVADQVRSIRYRGHGCPGPTRIETLDNAVIEKDYLDFWGEDDSNWQLPHRCKVCPDAIGDAADIAVSDTWDGGAPDRTAQHDDPGSNAAIVRTSRGETLIDSAISAGYVDSGVTLTPRDMDRFQPHQVAKKRAVWARFVGMRSAGRVVPDVRGLRLKPLARRNSLTENLRQARGARDRSRRSD